MSRHGLVKTFAATAAISLLGLAAVSAQPAPALDAGPSTPDDALGLAAEVAVRRGLNWLAAQQGEDGGWSNRDYPALTALPLWAFAQGDHPQRTGIGAKAARLIESYVQPDGGIYKPALLGRFGGGLSTYNTALCMAALHAWDKHAYRDVILNARRFVANSQIQGDSAAAGGFGYNLPDDSGRARADLNNTVYAIEAMRLTQDMEDLRGRDADRVDINWKEALAFVEKMQTRSETDPRNDGGFAYNTREARAGTEVADDGAVRLRTYGSMTYAGLLSLIYADLDRTDPRVQSAVHWAARHWTLDENPGMGATGLFYFYNVMTKALDAYGGDRLPRKAGGSIAWREEIIARLLVNQVVDEVSDTGYWVNNRSSRFWEGDAALVTSYSLLALQKAMNPPARPE
jgi:squalene-hopene/tetraprenyl-beta-curcumene cyclase